MDFIRPVLLSFSLLAFVGAAYSQEAKKADAEAKPSSSEMQSASGGASSQSATEMPTSKLIGRNVTDSQGKDIGAIKDVVVDLQKSKVHAVVVEFGGVLGVGGKNYAFPMNELTPGKKQDQLTLNVDKQKLETAEGFAKGQWPGMDDQIWGRVGGQGQASSAGGQQGQSGGQQGGKFSLVRGSKMMDADVQDKSGNPVGKIKDVVVNLSDGQLKNLLIDVKDAGQASVQAKALSAGTGDRIVLEMSGEEIRAQAKKPAKQAQSSTRAAAGASSPAGTPSATENPKQQQPAQSK